MSSACAEMKHSQNQMGMEQNMEILAMIMQKIPSYRKITALINFFIDPKAVTAFSMK